MPLLYGLRYVEIISVLFYFIVLSSYVELGELKSKNEYIVINYFLGRAETDTVHQYLDSTGKC